MNYRLKFQSNTGFQKFFVGSGKKNFHRNICKFAIETDIKCVQLVQPIQFVFHKRNTKIVKWADFNIIHFNNFKPSLL